MSINLAALRAVLSRLFFYNDLSWLVSVLQIVGNCFFSKTVVSIGHLIAFYVVLVPIEYVPSEPPIPLTSAFSFVLSKKVPLFSFEILQNHRYL